ncbi:MAG: cytochrome ubiquinol oxidase subunit I [Anaerolineae bacterium]|jgi:cytochrome d ubiquinol oxidase subunit I|nr:cytochrome ubiquinol oxidase subunit I [Anaerolineae bacterium]
MDPLILARWQFAITTVYHFFFVPLTLGLSVLVAIMQTMWFVTKDETWKRMTKFWGKLFLINFAMGVVTGIVQEFQFGMNWSEYSRFVGDVFGAPLAIEALLAFFLESTFIGIWLFGWNRLSPKVHLASIWLVAIASNISAFWILAANSWMQEPVGYVVRNGRAEMTDFGALLTNPHLWVQFPHVFFAGLSTGAFFMLGIVAFRLLRKDRDQVFFRTSFKMAALAAIAGSALVILVGHSQAQHMVQAQPMKMAAAEALWNTEESASMSLFTVGDTRNLQDVFSIRIPSLLSILACNRPDCAVQGINELQAQYEAQFGPGNYVPNVFILYWSFRIMVGAGFLMLAIALWALIRALRDRVHQPSWILPFVPFAIALPYLANSTGWLLTEMGRYPWMVFGVFRLAQGVSPVPSGQVLTTLLGFTLVYGALMVADVFLLVKYSRADTELIANDGVPSMTPGAADDSGLLLRPS